jgi:hypothetical protein
LDDQQADDIGFDLSSAVDSIAQGLFDREETPAQDAPDSQLESTETQDNPEVIPEPTQEEIEPISAPSSWAKDKHEFWKGMPREAQEYYITREKQMLDGLEQYKGDAGFGKQLKEVFTPYKAFLSAQGIDEPKAVQYLMNAHYKLSSAPPSERQAYFNQLAKSYGLEAPGAQQELNVDPHVKALQDEVFQLKSTFTQREQAQLSEQREKTAKEVEAFAAENPYFDEVADDIVTLLKGGGTLKDAYEKAVWANPVTRAKELARVQTEAEKQFKEKVSKEAAAAKKATAANVRSRDTGKAPTAPKGTMEDTMRETLRKIQERGT